MVTLMLAAACCAPKSVKRTWTYVEGRGTGSLKRWVMDSILLVFLLMEVPLCSPSTKVEKDLTHLLALPNPNIYIILYVIDRWISNLEVGHTYITGHISSHLILCLVLSSSLWPGRLEPTHAFEFCCPGVWWQSSTTSISSQPSKT